MTKFESGLWYTVEYPNGKKFDFRFLDTGSSDAESCELRVELCNGEGRTITIPSGSKVFKQETPCEKRKEETK